MSNYTLNAYGFVRWEGVPPQLVKQHTREFTKAAVAGIATQNMGVYGDPFRVQLSAVFPNRVQALAAETGYRTLIGAPQTLVYESVNYLSAYGHLYFVKDVAVVESRAHVRLIGPTYDYPSGWKVVSNWVLIPVA